MSMNNIFLLNSALFLAMLFFLPPACLAEDQQTWSNSNSDPGTLGWMRGFPPPVDRRITQPDSNFFSFPKMRWTVCHFRELLPTQQVSRGIGAPEPFPYDLKTGKIDAIQFTPLGGKKPLTWKESLEKNFKDGMLILQKGKIIYEYYSGCLRKDGKHGAMSMTKSLIGLLAEILVAEGKLDDDALVSTIIPELQQSGFGNATVRQVMDMTTALEFNEDYANPKADIWIYAAAASPWPKEREYTGPNGYLEYLQTVRAAGKHGNAFHYLTINTDVLGWIISRVTGHEVTDFLSQRIWSKIGAEQDAYMTVDGIGTPFAGGGLSAGLRDLGRIGQLMLQEGVWHHERLFPQTVVNSIQAGGSRKAFSSAGYKALDGASYRSMWWVYHNKNGAYAARGVHGQTIYIDPTAQMVLVRFASFPSAKNSLIDPTSLPAFQAVADYLKHPV